MRAIYTIIGMLLLVGGLTGCASTEPPEADPDPLAASSQTSVNSARARIARILNQLPRSDRAPGRDDMVLLLESPASTVVRDDVTLRLWLHSRTDEIWVEQTSGFPGTEFWFGPGSTDIVPVDLLPSARTAPEDCAPYVTHPVAARGNVRSVRGLPPRG